MVSYLTNNQKDELFHGEGYFYSNLIFRNWVFAIFNKFRFAITDFRNMLLVIVLLDLLHEN